MEDTVSERQGEIRAQDVALGRWPFARDPGFATCATKSLAESKKEPHKQLFLAAPILGMKRKTDTLDMLGTNKDSASTTNKNTEKKYYCSLCKKSATSERALHDHLQGKKHKNKEVSSNFSDPKNIISINSGSNRAYCSVCQVYIPSEKRVKVHLEGKKHRAKENTLKKPGQVDAKSEEAMYIENDDPGCVSDEEQVSGKSLKGSEKGPKNDDVSAPVSELVRKQEKKEEIVEGKILREKSWHCEMCNVTCSGEEGMAEHRKSSEHKVQLLKNRGGVIVVSSIQEDEEQEVEENGSDAKENEGKQETGTENANVKQLWYCQLCNETHDEEGMAAHRKTSKHISFLRE